MSGMKRKRKSDGALRFWLCLLMGDLLVVADALPARDLSFSGLTVLGILIIIAGCIPAGETEGM